MSIAKRAGSTRTVKNSVSVHVFHPVATVKCEGFRLYRSQSARDVSCLLDVNPSVAEWRCMSTSLGYGDACHVPDFQVLDADGKTMFIDAPDRAGLVDVAVVEGAARQEDARYKLLSHEEVYDGFRLRNAKDLLRYGDHVTPLGDRLRLLAALDEHGSLPLSECLKAFQETKPVAGVASLILRGFVDVNLDDGPLGPETSVRRISR